MEGIIGVYKKPGMTSHDVVFRLRKILKTKKIGHAGTLDPAVSGVLPICIGKATKGVEFLQDSGKIYSGRIQLGKSTTTEDAEGEVVEEVFLKEVVPEEIIKKEMLQLTGTITQIPPMFSAVKVKGKRLYEYARAGETVERPKRKAEIYDFQLTSPVTFNEKTGTEDFSFVVSCGKGTYVRTLAVDLGKALGYPAHMTSLVREKAGGISLDECLTLEEIKEKVEGGEDLSPFIKPLEFAFSKFPKINISSELWEKVKNGAVLSAKDYPEFSQKEQVALFYQDKIVSLYQKHPTKLHLYKPQKVLRNGGEAQWK